MWRLAHGTQETEVQRGGAQIDPPRASDPEMDTLEVTGYRQLLETWSR